MGVRLLAFQAPYRCRHRGVCCTEPWAIPVERIRQARIFDAVHTGVLQLPRGPGALFEQASGLAPDADVVVGRRGRECVFLQPGEGRRCAIHRDLGHDALPTACQHFPRVVVHDPRGVSLTLSYVCPTAADLLYGAGPDWHHVVHDGAVVVPGMVWEGLDARDTLPPQVSATRLWDWDAMTAFELETLRALSATDPKSALALIAAAAVQLEQPSPGFLEALVKEAFRDARRGIELDIDGLVRLAAAASTAPAPDLWTPCAHPDAGAEIWRTHQPQVSRYLASRVMASAVVYHARAASVWSSWLQTAYAVLRRSVALEADGRRGDRACFTAALARADRLLVHGIEPARLAAALHARSALPS